MWLTSVTAALAAKKKSGLVRLYQLSAGQCSPRAAGALVRANCETLDDVAQYGRAGFMALPNTGPKTVAEIGSLLPHGWPGEAEFTRLCQFWAVRCSTRAAAALARAGCETIDDAALYGRAGFMALPNTGRKTVTEIGDLLPGGWRSDQPTAERRNLDRGLSQGSQLERPPFRRPVARGGTVR
jgi:DNA-directed RNA polymerase alpha subunit